MKKRLKKYLCIICVIALLPIYAKADEVPAIEGLHEKLQRLIMAKCFTEEELTEIDSEYMESRSNFLRTQYIPGWIYLHPSTTEEEAEKIYEERMNAYVLDYSKGILVSSLYSTEYFDQYANDGHMYYLFDGKEYYSVPCATYSECGQFRTNGECIESIIAELGHKYNQFVFRGDSLGGELVEFLKNEGSIEQMLIAYGETEVLEIRIFPLDGIPTLYVRGTENEYLSIIDEREMCFNTIQPFIIYDAKAVMTDRKEYQLDHKSFNLRNTQKPTHETEAEALQSEGLLFGNENGLDLLKPMTRIEAVTMILRAIGNNDTATASAFSDVPAWHWGYNAANVAYEKGITSGIGNGEFAPERTITAEEFSAMILRLTNIGDFDWQDSVKILTEQGIISTDDARTMDLFTRGDMAKIIYEIRAHGLL